MILVHLGPAALLSICELVLPALSSGAAYFGFGLGITMGLYFGGGWGGWGGWGWHPGWGNRSVIVNNNFIHRNNLNASRGASLSGNSTWAHDAAHRGGVPYSNAAVSSRYGGAVRQNLQSRGTSGLESRRASAPIRQGQSEWATGRLRRAHPARTAARSVEFAKAARQGRRATTDIRASARPGAEAAEDSAGAAVAAVGAMAAGAVRSKS